MPESITKYQDFTNSTELRTAFTVYKDRCDEEGVMRTIPGLCRFLDISREEYLNFKRSEEYQKDFEQVELSMEDEWLQKLRNSNNSGAIFYLKNAYREHYKEVEPNTNPINIVFNAEQLNLIARRTITNNEQITGAPSGLRDSDEPEVQP